MMSPQILQQIWERRLNAHVRRYRRLQSILSSLRGTPHRWLYLAAMARAALPADHTVEKVKYYTTHVSGRTDADAPRRQHAYLRAIATIPEAQPPLEPFRPEGLRYPPPRRRILTTTGRAGEVGSVLVLCQPRKALSLRVGKGISLLAACSSRQTDPKMG
jgi:hypothetical protein